MDYAPLIPAADAVPATPWFFWFLGTLLFMVHIVLVNTVLGGGLITAYYRWRYRDHGDGPDSHLLLTGKIPVLIALAINFGVAPLLFVQVIYGHLYYTSSILMAGFTILVIPLLIAAYYAAYVHKLKYDSRTVSLIALGLLIALLFYIAFFFINNLSLMVRPERWTEYFSSGGGAILAPGEPVLFARLAHFAVASVAVGGLALALIGRFRQRRGQTQARVHIDRGLRIYAVATIVQVLAGLWYLFSQNEEAFAALTGGNALYTAVFAAGIALAPAAIIAAFRGRVVLTAGLFAAIMVSMSFTRAHVRLVDTGAFFSLQDLAVRPQYGVMALFIVVLIAGAAVIACMAKKALDAETPGARS